MAPVHLSGCVSSGRLDSMPLLVEVVAAGHRSKSESWRKACVLKRPCWPIFGTRTLFCSWAAAKVCAYAALLIGCGGDVVSFACVDRALFSRVAACGSSNADPLLIVTELLGRGSLDSVLEAAASNRLSVPWVRKLQFGIDAGNGLSYLHHRSPPILHRDLKSGK